MMNWLTRRPWLTVASVALLIHSAFILESHRHVFFQVPVVDAATYHNFATLIARGDPGPREAFWQPPLYPYLLAALYKISQGNVLLARCIQGLWGVIATLLVLALARRMLSSGAAMLAAILVAAYGPLLFYYAQLLPTGLAVTLNLLTILFTLRLLEKPNAPRALVCGFAFGLAGLTIPNALVCAIIPPAVLLLQAHKPQDRPRRLKLTAAFVLAVAICILPVTLRNWTVSRAWVPISTNGGINLYIGNNADMTSTMNVRPGLDWDRLAAMPFRNGASSAAEAQQFFLRKVRTHVLEAPRTYLSNLAKKTLLLVQAREIPRNTSIYAFRDQSTLLAPLVWKLGSFAFPFGIIGTLGLAGMIIATRGHRDRRLLAAYMLVYAATVVFFFPSARYRAPIVPGLVIFAILGAGTIIGQIRTGAPERWRNLAILLICLTLVNLPIRLPGDETRFDAELQMYVGVGLQVRGELNQALEAYDAVIAQDPTFADAFYYRGTVNRDLGRRIHAVTDFGEAIRLRSDHETAIHDLAVMLFEQEQLDASVGLLRRALRINPLYTRAMHNLGIGLIKQGKHEEGARWIHQAQKQALPVSR